MKRSVSGFMIFILLFSLLFPVFGEQVVAESGPIQSIPANNSKTVEYFGGIFTPYEPDMNEVLFNKVNTIGYEYDSGPIITESVLQFDLSDVHPFRIIEKVELEITQQSASNPDNKPYLELYGSYETGWSGDSSIPSLDVTIYSHYPIGTREVFTHKLDVTNYVMNSLQTSGEGKVATFVFKGATQPNPGDMPSVERRVYFYSKEHEMQENRPKLIVTYSPIQPPTGSLEVVGNGFTNKTTVNLRLSAMDPEQGQIEMNIYNEGQNLEQWEPFEETKEWIIPSGDGPKYTHVQFRSDSGAFSEIYSTTVILDTVKPTGSVRISPELTSNGVDFIRTPSASIQITGNDAYLDQMCLSNTADACLSAGWISFATTTNWTLDSLEDGAKTVYLWLKDKAGNISDPIVSNTVILDRTAPAGSVMINGEDDDYTNTEIVTLTLTADDGAGIGELEMQFSNDGLTWSMWETFSPSKSWNLSAGDGQKTVYVKLRDGLNNENVVSSRIYLDTTAPTGSISINNNATHTNDPQVTLTLEADDGVGIGQIEMQLSNDEQSWSAWENFTTSRTWNLSDTEDGEKVVYLKLKDGLGNESTFSSRVYLDRVAPKVTGVVDGGYYNVDVIIEFDKGIAWLNGNPFFFSGQTVSEERSHELLVRDRAGNETVVRFTIDKTAPWVSGVEEGSYYNEDVVIKYDEADAIEATLNGAAFASGDTVSAERSHELLVRDRAGNETRVSFSIDKTAPTGSISINKDATHTNASQVTLTLEADDGEGIGQIEMQLSNDEQSWSAWENFTTSRTWNLSDAEDGEKVVYLKLKDGVNNESVVSSRIYLDRVAPIGNLTINNGATHTNDPQVTLALEADDGEGIGQIKMQLSNDEHSWSEDAWEDFATSRTWNLSDTEDGEKVVYLKLKDGLGNESTFSSRVYLDRVAPKVTGVVDGGYYNTDVEIAFDKGTAWLNGAEFASGDTVSEERSHELLVRDEAGNETRISFSIDKTPPTGTLAINGEAEYTSSLSVALHVKIEDSGGSTKLFIRFSESLDTWGSPENDWLEYEIGSGPIEIEHPWSFQNDGISQKTIYMQIKDEAGNQNIEVISDNIIYQTIPEPMFNTISGLEDVALRLHKDDFVHMNVDQTEPYSLKLLTLPSYGELTLGNESVEIEQEILWVDLELKELIFTPDLDWNGTTELMWTVGNEYEYYASTATLTMNFAPVNDPPVAENLSFNTVAGSVLLGQLRATDVDNDEDELSFELIELPEKGEIRNFDLQTGTFEYVSNRGDHGVVTFTYQAFDGELYSEEATVQIHVARYHVEPIPEPPPSINPPTPPKQEEVDEVRVRAEGILSQAISTQISTQNGKKVLRVGFNNRLLAQKLDASEDTLKLVITGQIDILEAELTEEHFRFLNKNKLDLELETAEAVYRLPIQLLELKELKDTYALHDGEVRILLKVEQGSNEIQTVLRNQAQKAGLKIVKPVLSIQLFLVQNEQQYPINQLAGIVHGLVSIPLKSENTPSTAVLLLEDGSLLPLPTKWIETANSSDQLAVISTLLGHIGFVQTTTKSFKDMAGHWAQEEVEHLASLLILNGRNHEHFVPNDPVNRAEFTAILARGLGLWTERGDVKFADVKDNVWYESALQAVLQVGLVQGYGDQTFRPQQEISLEEASVILARALEFIGSDVALSEQEVDATLEGFFEQSDIKPWSREALALSIHLGLIEGEQFSSSPTKSVTRAQLAVMFDRLLRLL